MVPLPFETPYAYIRRAGHIARPRYQRAIRDLKHRRAIEVGRKQGKVFLKLTKKGELEALLARAKLVAPGKWDGKWRVVIFDIPEQAREKRDQLRWLLKRNAFKKLQSSVFISPFSLNRSAVEYLKKTRLINFIRILRVDAMDDDRDLLRLFRVRKKSLAT